MASSSGVKNVVVFGETGSGKSSVINLITKSSQAEVSDRAIGCTFKHQSYSHDGFTFYDTVGLNEGTFGRVPSEEAIRQLLSLLENLVGGVSLLMYVIPQGRIKEMTRQNFNFFGKAICNCQVPIILVVTRCEADQSMESWWKENEGHFRANEMIFADVVCGTALSVAKLAGELKDKVGLRREETRRLLMSSIRKCCLQKPWVAPTWMDWLKSVLTEFLKLFGTIGIHAGLNFLCTILLNKYGFSKTTAENLIASIKKAIFG